MPRRKYFKRLELLLCIMLVLVVVIVWILQSHLVYNVDHVDFFGKKLALTGDPLWKWLEKRTKINDHFFLYDNKMALLYDVVVDPSRRSLGRLGGEDMKDVWDQEEAVEYLELKDGFFTLQCSFRPSVRYGEKDHLNQWQESLKCVSDVKSVKTSHTVSGLTIALQRYEYVNLYHTMTDFYNAFLAMLAFDQHPDDITILWVDAHPKGGLDDVWTTLFGRAYRAARLPGPTRFSAMAWAAMGYNSPLNQHDRSSVGHLGEFRHFFLSRFGVDGGRSKNCSSLSLLFIWRRDYVAHPRNKGGSVSRKIFNENELMREVKKVVGPGDRVQGLQLDALPMKQQLEKIASTDILIGMHGAGLSHTLFLPQHGGLLELYPPDMNWHLHFASMASWRHLHYDAWYNSDLTTERGDRKTYVPPNVLVKMVTKMRNKMCGEK
ncbi:hypothetical protein BaRGS_00023640 [Batillaria attramentaria]|uniref:EGF domain-specific O-linked N-acetylglucosamine transferase n=1 Tax=Batillaria attramentaria TaxID=370345 RepID=A0ABD0KDB1_9CAEN